ncbi:hypothetical protein OJ253_419 [Cryptosporidium canis]|uniref:Uncharacterized protein n=1 Tax=Cryptosporidium canis TaxID=195482 RepID=A0A9D5HYX3_9CRYT|nr:hypothetical protein OJ253_419 [Cryptosporidium canis]
MRVELGGIVFELDNQAKVIPKRREAVLKVGGLKDEVKAEIDVLGELLFLGGPGGNEQGGLNVGEISIVEVNDFVKTGCLGNLLLQRGPKVADGAEGEKALHGAQGDDECSDQTAGVSEQGGISGVLDGAELGLSEILNKLGPR